MAGGLSATQGLGPPGSSRSALIETHVTILAAGMGTRLGRPLPKPLTTLSDGRTIIGQQLENIRTVLGVDSEILVVVGFKLEAIIEAFPDVSFALQRASTRRTPPRAC